MWTLLQSSAGDIYTSEAILQSLATNHTNTAPTGLFNIQPRPPDTQSVTPVMAVKRSQSFQCPYCSTKYTRQDNLKRHVKTHLVKV
jgi:uncharacterized Zn-finger protein